MENVEMTPEARRVLNRDLVFGYLGYVDPENIVAVAELVRAGLVAVESDYEGLEIHLTEAGRAARAEPPAG